MRRELVLTVEDILQDPGVTLVLQSRETFLAGLSLFRARADKGHSFTDCISMHTMRRLGLTDVLTNDRHFEKEGFRAILPEA
jgi:predicted nucleic acid-binding protein